MQHNPKLTNMSLIELRELLKAESEKESHTCTYKQCVFAEDLYDADKYLIVREHKAPLDDVYYFMMFHSNHEPCVLHTASNTLIQALLAMTNRMIIDNCDGEDTNNSVIAKKAQTIRKQFNELCIPQESLREFDY